MDRSALFGDRIGTLRLDCLHDGHPDSRSRQGGGDDPAISPVISRPSKNNRAIPQSFPVAARNLLGRGSSSALHQHTGRSSFLNGRPIALR